MADYSIWVLDEDSVLLPPGVSLDGVNQGDGSHLVGQTLTISNVSGGEIFISDASTDTNFADNDGNQTLNGDQVINGITYASGTKIEAEYRFYLVDDATGEEYEVISVNVDNSNPSYGYVEGLAFVDRAPPIDTVLRVDRAEEGPSNTGAGAVPEGDIVPLCFAAGTQVQTPRGPVAVDALVEGDAVQRPDGTFAVLRRVLRTRLDAGALSRNPKLRPVRILAGSLAPGVPARDLLVSRQHRMVVGSRIVQRMFGQREVLIPAIRLTALPGVFVDHDVQAVTYIHLVFDAHEVILAEGTPSESLFPGPEALHAMGAAARAEFLALFPHVSAGFPPVPPARFIPPVHKQKQLLARHRRNAQALVQPVGARPADAA